MKINTFGEFYNFIQSTLVNLHPDFTDFTACVSGYNSTCICKKQEKTRKFQICNEKYINVVQNIVPLFKAEILEAAKSKTITFSHSGGFVIYTLSA